MMPSQEDYLDSLLKGMSEGNDKINTNKEDAAAEDTESAAEASIEVLPSETESIPEAFDNPLQTENEVPTVEADTYSEVAEPDTTAIPEDAEPNIELTSIPEMSEPETADIDKMPGTSLEAFSDMSIADLEALSRLTESGTEVTPEISDLEEQEADIYSEIGDDIEERINMAAELPPVSEEFPDEDVMSMMEESDDSDLREIQELLKKSDNNEAIDSSVEELLMNSAEESEPSEILSGESQETREEKQRKKREEKEKAKAEKRAAAEAKKAEAAARKAARKAEKLKAKQLKKVESIEDAPMMSDDRMQTGDEQEFDASVLDAIVSEAGRAAAVSKDNDLSVEPFENPADGDDSLTNAMDEADEITWEKLPEETVWDDGMPTTADSEDIGIPDMEKLFESEALNEAGAEELIPELSEKAKTDSPKKKKNGILSRIFEFFTEEEEEEEENENIKLSQENQNILKELDSEKGKKKKKKDKKGRKNSENEEDDIPEKPSAKKKDAKKKESKKKPKIKKEKPGKEEPLIPEKKLTLKKMMPVFLVGVTVGILLFVFVNSAVDYTDKKTGREAFYEGDYQTCYQNLFGKELNETESVMFAKSKSILYIRLWLREYQMFAEEGDRVRGLDSLIQTIDDYPELYEYAQEWNAGEEVAAGYAEILNILQREYGMTEKQAIEIAELRKDEDYTRAVIAAAGGYKNSGTSSEETGNNNGETGEGESGGGEKEPDTGEILPDLLPEEEELEPLDFYDNQ
ncbi:MAG: hypothetical protein ACI4HQ_10400 [Acetatifactor sp.]